MKKETTPEEKPGAVQKLQTGPFYPTPEIAMNAVKSSPVYKQVTESLKDFEKRAKEVLKQGNIEDDVTAKAADALLTEMNAFVRELTKKGETVRAPYNATAKSIKAVFDQFGEMVAESNKDLRGLLHTYLKEKQEKERKEALLLEEQQKTLQAWIKKASGEMIVAKTIEELTEVGTKYIGSFKKELFNKLSETVVNDALAAVKKLGRERREYLNNEDVHDPNTPEANSEATMDAIAETIQAVTESPAITAMPVGAVKFNTKATKTLAWKLWKGVEEVDKSLLTVDPKAVDNFMAQNAIAIKASLNTGKPGQEMSVMKKGILFYYKEGTKVG